jgi:chloramphenicol 3-O phosphotransferase
MTPGNIILLNGASSAGKTSILQALQAVLDAPYLNLGIDKFISGLSFPKQERPLWDEVLGYTTLAGPLGRASPRGCQISSGMHHAIAALAFGLAVQITGGDGLDQLSNLGGFT